MASTYKGDSPGKSVTRCRMWGSVLRMMHLLDLPKEGVLVLAGEGGDVSYLQNIFGKQDIHAVDVDREALNFVASKYGVPCYHGEAGKVSAGIKYNMAHLDFCGRLSVDTLNTVVDVCHNMSAKGFIAITLLKGREAIGGNKRDLWGGVSRRQRRNALFKFRKEKNLSYGFVAEHLLSLRDGENLNPKLLIERMEVRYRKVFGKDKYCRENTEKGSIFGMMPNGDSGPLAKALIRMDVLKHCVEILLYTRGLCEFPHINVGSTWCYHSRTREEHGTPFFTSVVSVGFPVPSIVKKREFRFDVSDAKRSLSQLQNIVCNAPDVHANYLAEIFKISPRTVAAWRAHYTMGRYTFNEPPCVMLYTYKEKKGRRPFDTGNAWGQMREVETESGIVGEMLKQKPLFRWTVADLSELEKARRTLRNI